MRAIPKTMFSILLLSCFMALIVFQTVSFAAEKPLNYPELIAKTQAEISQLLEKIKTVDARSDNFDKTLFLELKSRMSSWHLNLKAYAFKNEQFKRFVESPLVTRMQSNVDLLLEAICRQKKLNVGLFNNFTNNAGQLLNMIDRALKTTMPAVTKKININISTPDNISKHYDPQHIGHFHQCPNCKKEYHQPGDMGPGSPGTACPFCGFSDQQTSAFQKCGFCKGSGSQPGSPSYEHKPCQVCGGCGNIQATDKACNFCKGSGFQPGTPSYEYKPCQTCGGCGWFRGNPNPAPAAQYKSCNYCKGNGLQPGAPSYEHKPCSVCGGAGIVQATDKPCNFCKGTGFKPGAPSYEYKPCQTCGGCGWFRGTAYPSPTLQYKSCAYCKGKGSQPGAPSYEYKSCTACGGYGIIETPGISCNFCKGNGFQPGAPSYEYKPCQCCLGGGWFKTTVYSTPSAQYKPCNFCKGNGFQPGAPSYEYKECMSCGGFGTVETPGMPCSYCRGTGSQPNTPSYEYKPCTVCAGAGWMRYHR